VNLRSPFPDPASAGRVIQDQRDRLGEMRAWCDAFTVQIEAQGQAYQDPELRRTVTEAVAAAQAAADALADGWSGKKEALENLANQKRVLEFLDRFDWEAYKEHRSTWRRVRLEFLLTMFDLRREIAFNTPADGITRISQRGCGAPLRVTGNEAKVALAFLQWVDANQQNFDPLNYTKQILARSGIKSSADFEANKAKMTITNPWATGPQILAP
jgi:hypothetical protein